METGYLTFLGGVIISLASLSVFLLSKNYALIPLFIITCYITVGETIIVAGYHFTPLRIIILVYIIRIIVKSELKINNFNTLDKIFIVWCIVSLILFSIRTQNFEEIKTKLGILYNAVGLYIMFRSLIRSYSDIENILKYIPVIIFPLALLMLFEFITGKNEFSVFGGVPLYSWVRDGKVRCQGPFRHAILAGTFGATLFPFMWYTWKENIGERGWSLIGIFFYNHYLNFLFKRAFNVLYFYLNCVVFMANPGKNESCALGDSNDNILLISHNESAGLVCISAHR